MSYGFGPKNLLYMGKGGITVPGAPTIGTATAGNAQASVTFTAPESNGGSAITSYTATSAGVTTYATLDSANKGANAILSGGNLTYANGATSNTLSYARATQGKSTDKWYWEFIPTSSLMGVGVSTAAASMPNGMNASGTVEYYGGSGNIYLDGADQGTFATFGSGAVVGMAYDGDAHTMKFYLNNSLQTTVTGLSAVAYYPTIAAENSNQGGTINFGASALTYTPPSGYTAGVSAIDSTPHTGTGASSPIVVTGLTNGTGYTCSVTATNAVGTGPASAASNSVTPAVQFMTATGGTITTDGSYKVHTFNSSDTFTVTATGADPTYGAVLTEVLVVAGGGGGGNRNYTNAAGGGGGGAGGLLYQTNRAVTATGYTVTIGPGGAGGTGASAATSGTNTVFDTITAVGGGAGGEYTANGTNGGSGGGGGRDGATTGGSATQGNSGGATGFGNVGGNGTTGAANPSAGGGGAGAAGTNAALGTPAPGGDGKQYSISGAATYYAGGGGGSAQGAVDYSCPGGLGGGGAGGKDFFPTFTAAISGTANTGGGGGGGVGTGYVGGDGGAGVVIVRYKFQ